MADHIIFADWCKNHDEKLLLEWDSNRNTIQPNQITYGSGQKVWWICPEGHSYEKSVSDRTRGKKCPVCFGKKAIIGLNDLETIHPEIAKQWHPTKNGVLKPSNYRCGSSQTVWWLGTCGHEWKSTIDNRVKGHGCPYCNGTKVHEGFNDLQTLYPEIAKQWHPTKNGDLKPTQVGKGSKEKVWWICDSGHEWELSIDKRVNGQNCPYCTGRKRIQGFNDLQTLYPEIAKQWHPTKNGNLKATDVKPASHKVIWWICEKQHIWKSSVKKRALGQDCPYCEGIGILEGKNDLFTLYPEIAKQWHPTKNGDLKPTQIGSNNSKNVWWLGPCGHEWQMSTAKRVKQNCGCYYCNSSRILEGFNDLETKKPEIAKQWHPTKNGDLLPNMVFPSSSKKVWWLGPCGHEWQAVISSRTNGNGCPICSKEVHTSFNEKAIVYYLSQKTEVIENYRPECLNKKELDIFLPKFNVGIEYDGQLYHNDPIKDLKKNKKCSENGIELIRIREPECPIIIGCKTICLESLTMKSLSKGILELLSYLSSQYNIDLKQDVDVDLDSPCIMSIQLTRQNENSLSNCNPELIKEWNYEKNSTLSPEYVPHCSGKKVWWKCDKGHEWQTSIAVRMSGSGCPYCCGRQVLPGFNDLESKYPEIAKQWHPNKNGGKMPFDYAATSGVKVWWLGSCGHEWQALISNRTKRKDGCPYCSNQKLLVGFNDLKTMHPDLAIEWNCEKNKIHNPKEVISGGGKKVWWKCDKGHEWQESPINRIRKGYGCPFCSGHRIQQGFNDLCTMDPELVKWWCFEKNIEIDPHTVSANSHKKVWWRCLNGHEWVARIDNIHHRRICPICSLMIDGGTDCVD